MSDLRTTEVNNATSRKIDEDKSTQRRFTIGKLMTYCTSEGAITVGKGRPSYPIVVVGSSRPE